jgi:hypothetical protein
MKESRWDDTNLGIAAFAGSAAPQPSLQCSHLPLLIRFIHTPPLNSKQLVLVRGGHTAAHRTMARTRRLLGSDPRGWIEIPSASTPRLENSRRFLAASVSPRRNDRASLGLSGTSHIRHQSLPAQLLKKQADRLNSPIEVRDMKLLIGRVKVIVRQAEAHHHAGNFENVLEIRHDGN